MESNGGSASKKRKPNSTTSTVSITPIASTSTLIPSTSTLAEPIATTTTIQSAPAPILSAVAARRAAALASGISLISNPIIRSLEDREGGLNDDSIALVLSSDESSSDSDEEEEELENGEQVDQEVDEEKLGELKTARKLRKKLIKSKRKEKRSTSSGRYFNGADDNEDGREGEGEGGIDRMEVEPTVKNVKIKLGRGRKQREKKSAFLDPNCQSTFVPEWNVNTFKFNWSNLTSDLIETGTVEEEEGIILCLNTDDTILIHGAYKFTLLFGSLSLGGSVLHASTSSSPSFASTSTSSSSIDVSLPLSNQKSTHKVFAPSSHPIPVLKSLQLPYTFSSSTNSYPTTLSISTTSSLSSTTKRTVNIESFSTIILLTPLKSNIEGIEKVLKVGEMGNGNYLWSTKGLFQGMEGGGVGGEGWDLISNPTPSLTSAKSLSTWESALDSLTSSTKSKSKSTPSNHQSVEMEVVEQEEEEEEEEEEELNVGSERMVLLVEGPKRVGKSTFGRMLINRLLTRYEKVAYLDTDLGQPEFTTAGLVSLNVLETPLFGPSFTHLSIPINSHFLGSLSPSTNPSAYSEAITSLIQTYNLEVEFPLVDDEISYSRSSSRFNNTSNINSKNGSSRSAANGEKKKIRDRIPLVINTQGWVKGLGGDLLNKLKEEVRATHLFHFEAPVQVNNNFSNEENGNSGGNGGGGENSWNENNYSGTSTPQHQSNFNTTSSIGYSEPTVEGQLRFNLESAPFSPLDSKWSSADLRTLNFISYFHSVFPTTSTTSNSNTTSTNTFPMYWDFSLPLVSKSPYSIDWTQSPTTSNSNSSILLKEVHILQDEISYSNILHALNGSIVAILSSTSNSYATANNGMDLEEGKSKYKTIFPFDSNVSSPSPNNTNCLGLGLIRSIDTSTNSLLILTPVPSPSHSNSNSAGLILVKGSLELPIPLMLDFNQLIPSTTGVIGDKVEGICGVEWKDVPFLSIDSNEGGGGRNRFRRNLMRRGQQG